MPDKTCQFCGMVGPAFTFINGVTICQPCFKTVPADIHEAWKTIFSLRTRAEAAERERDEAYAKGQRDRTAQMIEEIKLGRTAVNFNHIPAVARALDWLYADILASPIKERP